MVLNIPPRPSVKFCKGLFAITMVIVISIAMGPGTPATGQNVDNSIPVTDQIEPHEATPTANKTQQQDAAQGKSSRTFVKIMIAFSFLIISAMVFILFAPFFAPFQSKGDPSQLIEKFGCDNNNKEGKKVLVAYCTRHGATSSIAAKISEVLCDKGFQVDLRAARNIGNEDLSTYDAFVVGSGVIWSKLTPRFQEFLEKQRHLWPHKPHALFAVCLTIQRDNEANRKRVKSYIEDSIKHLPEFKPFAKTAFAGRVDMEKLTFWESTVLKLFFMVTPQKGGDHRDLNKVTAWAEELSKKI